MSKMNLKVEDMSCGHCVAAIQGALESVAGVTGVDASLDTKVVTVTVDSGVQADAVLTAIRGAGYTPELQD
jgi:copper chaperone